MFLRFANFCRQFIRTFSKITAPLLLILKTIALSIPARPTCTRANKNKFGTDDSCSINSCKIDNQIANLSSSLKKIHSRTDFFTPKASLAFTQLKNTFIKALILHHFDSKRHIQIETNASSYTIGGLLNQLTTKRGLANQMINKTNNQSINPLSEIDQ